MLPQQSSPSDDVLRVAYHEASHALASFRADGLPRVTIIPTEEALGRTAPDGLEDVDDRTFVRICLAGPAMDLERGRDPSAIREEMWADFEIATPFIARNGWDEVVLLADAREWVRSELRAITAVAERLAVDKKLTDTEIALIVGDADGDDLEAPLEVLLRLVRESENRGEE